MARLTEDTTTCPACRASMLRPILYGYPSAEGFEAADRGEVALGGCVVFSSSPDYVCRACGTLFRVVNDALVPTRPS